MGMYLMRICGRILRLDIFRLPHYTSNKGFQEMKEPMATKTKAQRIFDEGINKATSGQRCS